MKSTKFFLFLFVSSWTLIAGCPQLDPEKAEGERHELEIRLDGVPVRVIDIDPNAEQNKYRLSFYNAGARVSGVSASPNTGTVLLIPVGTDFFITGTQAGGMGIVTFSAGGKESKLRVFVRNWNEDDVYRHGLDAGDIRLDTADTGGDGKYQLDPTAEYDGTDDDTRYKPNKLAAYRLVVDRGFHYEAPDGLSRRVTTQFPDAVHADIPRETPLRKIHPQPHIIPARDWEFLPNDTFRLYKKVFKFTLHFHDDGDMVGGYDDRQRLELKTMDNTWPPEEEIKSEASRNPHNRMYSNGGGDTFTHRWKFRLPQNFRVSSEYTHIHQIKPEGGDSGNPTFTLTGRKLRTGREVLQLIYRGPIRDNEDPSVNWYPCEVDLEPFKGEWIRAEETVTYDNPGAYRLRLVRIRDMRVLMEYIYSPEQYDEFDPFAMYRKGNSYIRPKFGVYRRVMHMSPFGLPDPDDPVVEYRAEKNEMVVLFADFEMDKLKR